MAIGDEYAATLNELADALGISRQAFHRLWASREGRPEKGKKGHNVTEWRKFHQGELQRKSQVASPEKKRFLDLKCEKLEIEIQEARGALVPKEELDRVLIASHSPVKNVLLASKRIAAQEFADVDVAKKWGRMVDDALAKLEEGFSR